MATVLSAFLVAAPAVAQAAASDGPVFRYRMSAGSVLPGSGGGTVPGGGTTPGDGTGTPGNGGGTTTPGGSVPGPGNGGDPADGGDRFIPLEAPAAIAAGEGERVDVVVGNYEGNPDQWGCQTIAAADWLSCAFSDGAVHAVGYAPAATTATVTLVVERTGYTADVSLPVAISPVEPRYTASAVRDGYTQSGETAMLELGAYTGLGKGWTCAGSPNQLPSWASCAFKEGKAYLTGKPPASRGSHYNGVKVYQNGELKGQTGLFTLNWDRQGYGTPHDDAHPRSAAATLRPAVDLYAVAGRPFRFPLGTYSGGDGGWLCWGHAAEMPSWASCEFKDGKITLVGTAPTRPYFYTNVGVVRDGVLVTTGNLFTVNADGRDYMHGAATTEEPRSGSTVLDISGDYYVEKGADFRFKIGTYTGGDGGWLCYGKANSMNAWQSCDFKDGEIFLVGKGPGRTYDYSNLGVVRDGVLKATSRLFTVYSDVQGYTQGASQPLDPRPATVSLTSTRDLYFPAGATMRYKLGTYSNGDGGWTCFGNVNPLPTWQNCEFKDGGIYLVGTAPSKTYSYTTYGMVRDGRHARTSTLFYVQTDAPGYGPGQDPADTPRGGSVSFSVAGNVSLQNNAGIVRHKIGTYTGGDGGWTCFGNVNAFRDWMSCEFKDGEIFLTGRPSAGGSLYTTITAVRDAQQMATSNLVDYRW